MFRGFLGHSYECVGQGIKPTMQDLCTHQRGPLTPPGTLLKCKIEDVNVCKLRVTEVFIVTVFIFLVFFLVDNRGAVKYISALRMKINMQ